MAQRLYFGLSGIIILLAFLIVSSCGSKKVEPAAEPAAEVAAEVAAEPAAEEVAVEEEVKTVEEKAAVEIPAGAIFIDDFQGVPKLTSDQAMANQRIIDKYNEKKTIIAEIKKLDIVEKAEVEAKVAEIEAEQEEFEQLVKEKIKDEAVRAMIANAKNAEELEKILRENTDLTEEEIQELVKKKAILVKKDKTLRLDVLGKIHARLVRNKEMGLETSFCDAASSLDNFVINPIYYATDVYAIEKQAASTLYDNVDKIIDAVDNYPELVLQVEGNCDERGSNVYNKSLGDYRWTGAVPLLVSMQFDKQKIRGISKGEECLTDRSAAADEVSWWKVNRRSDFTWILKN